ncbi:MAG: hypothetical protein OXE77_11045 [Flavobacteriaceae bacterium]|nr:hypothetical protein [Flavobacteriaceae bacterium]MCY4268132.1 hypothetical protein [Flavobacteriaceae bacterium]MCY4298956.1 hypothetical protein [Flavobacteriaceae bacterium]
MDVSDDFLATIFGNGDVLVLTEMQQTMIIISAENQGDFLDGSNHIVEKLKGIICKAAKIKYTVAP